ncbi:unnamed protein product [Protopolystoma xenopodis]|uniref:Uncharacterized protein n=1 Tax=Protopolystoma xenopodis TaxID=117903 RepID=A0A448XIW1_9PLAT|nr:unnamed protein product [Protopolystoma xenopodis]
MFVTQRTKSQHRVIGVLGQCGELPAYLHHNRIESVSATETARVFQSSQAAATTTAAPPQTNHTIWSPASSVGLADLRATLRQTGFHTTPNSDQLEAEENRKNSLKFNQISPHL